MSSETPVLVERHASGYAVVTLNRPQAMNALSRALRKDLAATFQTLAGDKATRVIILTGAGRAFTAGLDLKELGVKGYGTDETREKPADLVAAMATFKGPIIGAINGAAVTGGFELALACDFLIASTAARFADTHGRVGLMPGWGLSQKLPRLIGIGRAKEMSFTGNFIGAEQALACGLVNRVVAPDQLLPVCRALATDMVGALPHMLPELKGVIDEGYATTFGEGLVLERSRSAGNASVNAAEIEKRRADVVARGKTQQ